MSPRFCAGGDASFAVVRLVGGGVVGAGFALPRDAGRRPALQACTPPGVGGAWPSAQKTMAANSVRCPRDRGESVKGGPPPPFHKSTMTNRNSPPRAAGAQGSFDCRREAPGGPRTGPQLQAELRPKAIPDQGPVRGPLDPDCRSEAPTGRTGQRSMSPRFCAGGDASFAGLRPAVPTGGRRSTSRPRDSTQIDDAPFAAVRLAGGGVVGAGFALPRDAGQRPALHVPAILRGW